MANIKKEQGGTKVEKIIPVGNKEKTIPNFFPPSIYAATSVLSDESFHPLIFMFNNIKFKSDSFN